MLLSPPALLAARVQSAARHPTLVGSVAHVDAFLAARTHLAGCRVLLVIWGVRLSKNSDLQMGGTWRQISSGSSKQSLPLVTVN